MTEIPVTWRKRKQKIQPLGAASHFNNQAHNKAIKCSLALRVSMILVFLVMAYLVLNHEGADPVLITLLYNYVLPMVILSAVVPILVLVKNPDILRFFLREFVAN